MATKTASKKETEITAVNEQQIAQATVARLLALGRVMDIALPEQTEEMWRYAQALENEAAVNMAKRGLVYLALKERVGHGEFLRELEARGVTKQRAHEAMSVAQMLAALPPAKVRTFGLLAGSKLIELAKIPVETLEEMESQGSLALDDVDTMSVRDLKHHLRRERLARETAETKLHAVQEKAARQGESQTTYPPLVMAVRQESAALSEQINLAVDDLEQVLARLESPLESRAMDAAHFGIAATTLYHQVRAAYGKTARLMTLVQQHLGEHVGMGDEELPQLLEEELAQWQFARELIIGEHRARATSREMIRQAGAPQKRQRGRRSGTKQGAA